MKKRFQILSFMLFTIGSYSQNCGDLFMDSGGVNGNYSQSENITTTICPDNAGDFVKVQFISFDVESTYDWLKIYNGDSATSTLLGEYNGTTIPEFFTSTDSSGCLTFVFTSDGSVSKSGWVANIYCGICLFPTVSINEANITINTAEISLLDTNATPPTNGWEIEYGISGFIQGSGIVNTSSVNTYQITGLTGGTKYDVYVRANCNSGDYSFWNGPYQFTTVCDAEIAPYTQDFENAGEIPNCWSQGNSNTELWQFSNTTSGSHVGNLGDVNNTTTLSGGYFAYVDDSLAHSLNTALVSRLVDISNLTNPELSFYIISNNEGASNVGFSVDIWDGAQWNEEVYTSNTNTNGWKQIYIDLSSLTVSGPIQVKFIVDENNGTNYRDDFAIDDIRFDEVTTCIGINNLITSNVTLNSVEMSWMDDNTPTATNWTIVYGNVGFNLDTEGTSILVNTNPFTLTGLTTDTFYEFYIQTNCGANVGDDDSNWSSPYQFKTLCNVEIAPYTQDFENAGEIPNCWSQGNSNTELWQFSNTTSGNHVGNLGDVNNTTTLSGGYFAYVDDSGQNSLNTALVTSLVDISNLTNPELSFYAISNNEGTSNVDFSVDIWDGAQWNEEVYTSNTNTNGWEQVYIDLSSLTVSGLIQVKFIVDENNGTDFKDDFAIDDIKFDEVATCIGINNLITSNVTLNSVEMSWTDNNTPTATNWTIVYGNVGFNLDTEGTSILVNTNPFTLTGLTTNTFYEFYVQTNCGANVGDDDSNWSSPYQFKTLCDVEIAPYTQDFENAGEIPNCWLQGNSNTESWQFSNNTSGHVGDSGNENTTTLSGGYFAYVDNSPSHSLNTALVSPLVDISNLTNPELSFYAISNNEGTSNVDFSVDIWDGAQWNEEVYTSNTNTNGWEQVYIDLSSLTVSGPIQVKFIVDENNGTDFKDDFAIDDVSFNEVITCRDITAFVISDITDHSATITWSDNNLTTPIGWEIEIVEIGDTPTGSGVLVNTMTYNFDNLLPLRNYKIYIRVQCSATDFGNWKWVNSFITLTPIAIDVPYNVSIIPFQLYNQLITPPTINRDDVFSENINLEFDFNFFGYSYSEVNIGTNSVISFDPNTADQYCNWAINSAHQLPNVNIFGNVILGVYQDYYDINDNNGTIAFGYVGTAPFRKFVVFFDDVSLYRCRDITSTNQMVLYETYNYIDVQVKDRNICETWNNKNAILGIQSIGGNYAYFPGNRNTGNWEAHNEAHRFKPENNVPDFQYIICDTNVDGVEVFDLNLVVDHFNDNTSGITYSIHISEEDANNNVNAISGNYTNTTNAQTIYVRRDDANVNEVTILNVLLAAIDCAADYDLDTISNVDEDLNANGNFGDDDTDGDGIPDFLDEDDDDDYVLTRVEALVTIGRGGLNVTQYLDTDGDNIPNYLDNDDDNDGILTIDEDYNGDYNPTNDDIDSSGIADYLEINVALGTEENMINTFSIYPNPTKNQLTIQFKELQNNTVIKIYSLQGQEVYKKENVTNNITEIDVSKFGAGIYFVNVRSNEQISTKKFVKE